MKIKEKFSSSKISKVDQTRWRVRDGWTKNAALRAVRPKNGQNLRNQAMWVLKFHIKKVYFTALLFLALKYKRMADRVKSQGRKRSWMKSGSQNRSLVEVRCRVSVSQNYFDDVNDNERLYGKVLSISNFTNKVKVLWEVDGSMTCCPVNDLQVEKEGSISDGDGEREVEERIKEEQGSEERRESDDGDMAC